ncbi:hypothetical protein BJ508DRAFT_320736 [Ascobolus immersus RN42]|uniref:Uncharacterized protein n=1 Tax=Ascobolus immersus RN42 TaxID=1160509 RepID=A0A3N4INK6_ASCIM|nr:hypothetical protein BJ508DRAFT_320736 [Ascobolus immersus RN42]
MKRAQAYSGLSKSDYKAMKSKLAAAAVKKNNSTKQRMRKVLASRKRAKLSNNDRLSVISSAKAEIVRLIAVHEERKRKEKMDNALALAVQINETYEALVGEDGERRLKQVIPISSAGLAAFKRAKNANISDRVLRDVPEKEIAAKHDVSDRIIAAGEAVPEKETTAKHVVSDGIIAAGEDVHEKDTDSENDKSETSPATGRVRATTSAPDITDACEGGFSTASDVVSEHLPSSPMRITQARNENVCLPSRSSHATPSSNLRFPPVSQRRVHKNEVSLRRGYDYERRTGTNTSKRHNEAGPRSMDGMPSSPDWMSASSLSTPAVPSSSASGSRSSSRTSNELPLSSPGDSSTPVFSSSPSPSQSTPALPPSPKHSSSPIPSESSSSVSSVPPAGKPLFWTGKAVGVVCSKDPAFSAGRELHASVEPYMNKKFSGKVIKRRDCGGWKRLLIMVGGYECCWFSSDDEKVVRNLLRNGYTVHVKGEWVVKRNKYDQLGGFFVIWKAQLRWEVYDQ